MAGSSRRPWGPKSLTKFFLRRKRTRCAFHERRTLLERLEPRVVLNGLPLAVADPWYSTPQNTALVVNSQNHPLLENDWDPEGSTLSASVVTNPTTGSLSNFNASAGTFTYTPNSGFSGVDTFTYKVNDGTSDSPAVTASIAVGGNFGPRTNGEESARLDGEPQVAAALPTSLAANTAAVPFSASGLTGNLEYTQALTPGLRLLYNSGTFARPIVVLETFLMPSSAVPDEIKAQLTFNGTAGTNYSYNTTGLQAGQALRFALQADASSLASGRYAYSVTLTARFGANSITRTYSGYQEVVNRSSSTYEFGRGWQFEGLDRLVSSTGGMLLVRSAGDALWFADNGSGGYLAAAGDQTFATLVRNVDNSYTLTDKHGIKANFSSGGLLTSRIDRNNNTTTYTYTNNLLTQVTDPFGRNTNLTYTNGRLASVTDFASPSASLAYDGSGRLTSVTQPDPDGGGALTAPVWTFGYDATTHQLTQVTNPLSQSTGIAYGAHRRLTTITHPGASTWQLTALQTIGLPTGASGNTLTNGNPQGTVTDERGKQWRFRADRFGRLTE